MEKVDGLSTGVVRRLCKQLVDEGKITRTINNDKSKRFEYKDSDLPVILEAVEARKAEIAENGLGVKAKSKAPADPPPADPPPADPAPADPAPADPAPADPTPDPKESLIGLVKAAGSRASVRPDRAKTPQAKKPAGAPAVEGNTWLWVGIGAVLLVIVVLAAWMARRRGASAGPSFDRPLPQGEVETITSSDDEDIELDMSWKPDNWE